MLRSVAEVSVLTGLSKVSICINYKKRSTFDYNTKCTSFLTPILEYSYFEIKLKYTDRSVATLHFLSQKQYNINGNNNFF